MNDIIEQRKKVYQEFPKENLIKDLSELVPSYKLSNEDYSALQRVTKDYLLKSLNLSYKQKFIWEDDFLEKNSDFIMNLPNKTPNGIIKPKSELIKEYNDIQKVLNDIMIKLKIFSYFTKFTPINIRFKPSTELKEVESRPYFTGKHHSDAWVGHKGDCQLLIGVLGDVNNNTVEFNEPLNVHNNYLSVAESFDEGNTRYGGFKKIGLLREQTLAIMDHACLHRTFIKNNSKPRLSIDIASMVDSKFSHVFDDNYNEDYIDYYSNNVIKNIGSTNTYEVKESIKDDSKNTIIKIKTK